MIQHHRSVQTDESRCTNQSSRCNGRWLLPAGTEPLLPLHGTARLWLGDLLWLQQQTSNRL